MSTNYFKSAILTSVISISVLFVSCDIFNSGINLTKSEETAKLNDLLNKHIPADMLVNEIRFDYSLSSSSFSLLKDGAVIIYVDPENNTVLHGIEVNLKTGDAGIYQWLEDHPSNPTKRVEKGVQLVNFDFSKITPIVNEAIQIMTEDSLETNGIGSFEIDFSSGNLDTYRYSFKLQHRTGSQKSGRRTSISYNEYSFKADKDGKLDY
jgi:hypothetical protein